MKYNRHYYRLHLKDDRYIQFIDYEYMRSWWMTHAKTGLLSHVEVIDISKEELNELGVGTD